MVGRNYISSVRTLCITGLYVTQSMTATSMTYRPVNGFLNSTCRTENSDKVRKFVVICQGREIFMNV